MPRPIILAAIGAPHGVKGEVRLKSFAADPMALTEYGPLSAPDGRTFVIERLRPAKSVLIAKLRGIDDRDAAERLRGVTLSVDRSALPTPEEDEFYHADLIGLAAFDPAGAPLGKIAAVHDYGAGDILEITPPKGAALLVPFTRAAVPEVDIAAGRVIVAPPAEVVASPDSDNEEREEDTR